MLHQSNLLHYSVIVSECIEKTNQLCVLSGIFVMDGFIFGKKNPFYWMYYDK